MSHRVEGFVARRELFERIGRLSADSVVIPLRCGIAMMIEPDCSVFLEAADPRLDVARQAYGLGASLEGRIGFVATDYDGGRGRQGGGAWWNGEDWTEFWVARGPGPINGVLQTLGVRTEPVGPDEFDRVGLGHYRSHEDWIEFARTGKARWERAPIWSAD